jgi:hypothetical protein
MSRALVLTALSAVLTGGCAVQVQGAYDDVTFAPTATAVAIFDAHDVRDRDGAVNPVERPLADKRLHVWLSGADVPEGEDWRFLDDERLLDVKKQLAGNDLLVLRDVSFDRLADGDDLSATADSGGAAGDFTFSVSQRLVPNDQLKNGVGNRITIEIEPTRVEAYDKRTGTFEAKVFVKRQRDIGQAASDVATGEVAFALSLPFAPERLAEANFAFVAPIAACGAAAGPGNNRGCDDVERRGCCEAFP